MTINANEHPFKVQIVEEGEPYANDHPYKVEIVGGGGGGFEAKIVDELPEIGQSGYLYLVLKEETPEGNIYDEYIWAEQPDESFAWEHLGATDELVIPQSDWEEANPDDPAYIKNKPTIKDVNDYVIKGAGAPTTSTVGTVGKLYEDTTNGKLYQCTAVVPGTDPDPDTYTWEEVGGGALYSTTGENTDGAMTQKATTDMIWRKDTIYNAYHSVAISQGMSPWNSEYNPGKFAVAIARALGSSPNAWCPVSVGHDSAASGDNSIAIGGGENSSKIVVASGAKAIAIGTGSRASQNNATAIGQTAIASGLSSSVALGYSAAATGIDAIALATGAYGSKASGSTSIAIGSNTWATGESSIALGTMERRDTPKGSVAIGRGAAASAVGEFNIGSTTQTEYGYNSSNYRLLTGLYDPQSAHDAATKGYVDGLVGDIESALHAINNGGN